MLGCAPERITTVTRFERGDRHAVFAVRGDDDGGGLVVRVSVDGSEAERATAALEAAVLSTLRGAGAPRLLDFRETSAWFDAPAMAVALVPGSQRELHGVAPVDIERLGAVVASVHSQEVDELASSFPATPPSLAAYVELRFDQCAAYLPRLRSPLPSSVATRIGRAFSEVGAGALPAEEPLVLLHGDIASGNVLWSPEPVLIDWEYARLGDPADEIAYVFAQEALDADRRHAFWRGYAGALGRPVDRVVERAGWWEPVTMLGSALWWLERWSRRTDADEAGADDPSAPKPADHYLDEARRRLDRLDEAMAGP